MYVYLIAVLYIYIYYSYVLDVLYAYNSKFVASMMHANMFMIFPFGSLNPASVTYVMTRAWGLSESAR